MAIVDIGDDGLPVSRVSRGEDADRRQRQLRAEAGRDSRTPGGVTSRQVTPTEETEAHKQRRAVRQRR